MSTANDDDDGPFDMFDEPKDYFQPEKQPTHQDFQLQDGSTVQLRLVGHNPLWGHHLWQAGRIIATYLETDGEQYLKGKSVLELGAAAALPSIVAARHGAATVVATDYPDSDLIDNIQHNLEHCTTGPNVHARGYLWGADAAPVKALAPGGAGFDTLILADLLFNHSCHEALLKSIETLMRRSEESIALVFFTPYRPWLLEKDMAFFDLVRRNPELRVTKLGEWKMDSVMFAEDRGDEELRRTVFGFEVRWTLGNSV